MQARVCVEVSVNGDIQGFLFLDEGAGEMLVTTSAVYAAGSPEASAFNIMGTKGNITATAAVDVDGRVADFSIDFTDSGGTTTSVYSRPLTVSASPC